MAQYEGTSWRGIDLVSLKTLKTINIETIEELDSTNVPYLHDGKMLLEKAGAFGTYPKMLAIIVKTLSASDLEFLSKVIHYMALGNPQARIRKMSESKKTLILIHIGSDFGCDFHPELELNRKGEAFNCPNCNAPVRAGMMHPQHKIEEENETLC